MAVYNPTLTLLTVGEDLKIKKANQYIRTRETPPGRYQTLDSDLVRSCMVLLLVRRINQIGCHSCRKTRKAKVDYQYTEFCIVCDVGHDAFGLMDEIYFAVMDTKRNSD